MGVLHHISHFFGCSYGSSKVKEHKQLQTVEVRVRIDGEECERAVKRALKGMKGVKQVKVEREANKVTVVGYVDSEKVVARVTHRTGKMAELWPSVRNDVVEQPYEPKVYDNKSPPRYVRNDYDHPNVTQFTRSNSTEVRYIVKPNDDPTACAIM